MKQGVIQRSEQLYRLLVKLYPKKFKEHFGEEMIFVFAELLQDAQEEAGSKGLALLTLNIEPPFASLKPPVPVDRPDVIDTAIALSLIVLLPIVAFVINLVPIRRAMRAGGNLLAYPLNVVLVVAVLLIIASFIGAIIVDQYPCWIGVPNCD